MCRRLSRYLLLLGVIVIVWAVFLIETGPLACSVGLFRATVIGLSTLSAVLGIPCMLGKKPGTLPSRVSTLTPSQRARRSNDEAARGHRATRLHPTRQKGLRDKLPCAGAAVAGDGGKP